MVEENRTTQIMFGSRGLKVMVAIFVTSYVVLAGTVGFLMYERVVGVDADSPQSPYESLTINNSINYAVKLLAEQVKSTQQAAESEINQTRLDLTTITANFNAQLMKLQQELSEQLESNKQAAENDTNQTRISLNITNENITTEFVKLQQMLSEQLKSNKLAAENDINQTRLDLYTTTENNNAKLEELQQVLSEQLKWNKLAAENDINKTRHDLNATTENINAQLEELEQLVSNNSAFLDVLIDKNIAVFRNLNELNSALEDFTSGVILTKNMTGVAYTRWGKSSCSDSRQTTQMYSGFAASVGAGGDWTGGGSILCLPEELQWNRYNNETYAEYLFSTAYGADELFDNEHKNKDVACVVCNVMTRSAIIMIPGRRTCYPGWTDEYSGYLMGDYGSSSICIDEQPEDIRISNETLGSAISRLYYMEIYCNSNVLCQSNVRDRQLTCVVCTK